jgi:hypothetical protein
MALRAFEDADKALLEHRLLSGLHTQVNETRGNDLEQAGQCADFVDDASHRFGLTCKVGKELEQERSGHLVEHSLAESLTRERGCQQGDI